MLRSRFQKGKRKRKRTRNQTICHERMLTLSLGIDYQQITMNPTLQMSRCTEVGCEKFSMIYY
jgi:hypothetical protein